MIRIVIAPDKFKGSLSAIQAARAMQRGALAAAPNSTCVLVPMADGGEGTLEAFLAHGAQRRSTKVHGPLGKLIRAPYAMNGTTAIIEMASASGLGLLKKSQYNVIRADTFGTGQLIAALNRGARRLILGIGGSATNDGGTGMLRALGIRFLDERKREIRGGMLAYQRLHAIDVSALDPRVKRLRVEIAGDVDNPLCGPTGASYTFAKQKGATRTQIAQLDRVLSHIADVVAETIGRDYRDTSGAGAAGGLGFALLAFLRARMEPGVQLIAREVQLSRHLRGATLCLTGEGKIDEQTLHGKTVLGVAKIARKQRVPVIAFGGAIEPEAAKKLRRYGVDAQPIAPRGTSPAQSMRNAAALLEKAATCAVVEAMLS